MSLNLIGKLSSLTSRVADKNTVTGKASKWGMPIIESNDILRVKSADLAPFTSVEINIDADVSWSPGSPSINIQASENFYKHIKVDLSGSLLTISSSADFKGIRPVIEIRSRRLLEMHVSATGTLYTDWVEGDLIIATARGSGSVILSGNCGEAHCECIEDGVVDAASLDCKIAAAELSGNSVALLRATEALSAELRDGSSLLTVGSPKVLEAKRI